MWARGRSYRGPFSPLDDQERGTSARLARHVHRLAADVGERHVFRPDALHAAENYIADVLCAAGLPVRRQSFECTGGRVSNLEAVLPAGDRHRGVIVIGAHYDTVVGSPGANDNASGVAVLLELADLLQGDRLGCEVRFVAFVNEEPPFFRSAEMGSYRYARQCRQNADRVVAMICLETVGYYSDQPGSQAYPPLLRLLYPSAGNFVTFVGNLRSWRLVRSVTAAFRARVRFPSEAAVLPTFVPGIDWSDQWAFWKLGYPALMVTDTALYRYPHYHSRLDTPDRIDYARMARVTVGLAAAVRRLTG